MNEQFSSRVMALPDRFEQLMQCELMPIAPRPEWKALKAVYAFFEGDTPCYVGRTRNLHGRMTRHVVNSHNSATFAFKEAKRSLGNRIENIQARGRSGLFLDETFQAEFQIQKQRIRLMKLRFVPIEDALDQYLFELYAALELGTPLDEFDTH